MHSRNKGHIDLLACKIKELNQVPNRWSFLGSVLGGQNLLINREKKPVMKEDLGRQKFSLDFDVKGQIV